MNRIKILYKQYGLGVFNRIIIFALKRFGLLYETILVFEKHLSYEDLNKRLMKIDISNVKRLTLADFESFSGINRTRKELYKKRLEKGSYLVFGIFDRFLAIFSHAPSSFPEGKLGFKKLFI